MKLRYVVLSSLFVCGAMLSVDMNTSQAAKANVNTVKSVSNSDYGDVVESGKLKGEGSTMEYTLYKDENGYTTAVYGSGYVGDALKNLAFSDFNPYELPDADHHLFAGNILDESLEKLFYNVKTQKITMNKTPNLKNASGMFQYSKASEIDVSKMTTDKVTDMSGIFGASSVRNLDISNWDMSNVTNMTSMFSLSQVQELDVSNWDTSKVTDMNGMFAFSQFQHLDVSNWDTSNVTDMNSMFAYSKAQHLDVSNWDTSKVTDMSGIFDSSQVQHLDVSNWNTSNVTDMRWMFRNSKAQHLDVSKWDTSKVTDMTNMFRNSQIQQLDVSNWDTSKVKKMNNMFTNSQIKTITYGPKFGSLSGTDLPSPSTTDGYTGKWIQIDSQGAIGDPLSQDEFLIYIPDNIQTWTWQKVLDETEKPVSDSIANVTGQLYFYDSMVDPNLPEVIPPDLPGATPENPGGGGSSGSGNKNFYIAWASDLNFGGIARENKTMIKYASPVYFQHQKDKLYAPFVQIVDKRLENTGWDLSVSMSPFLSNDSELKGVSLAFNDITVIDSLGDRKDQSPIVSSGQQLNANDTSLDFVSSRQGQGQGVWTFSFTDSSDGFYSDEKGVSVVIPKSTVFQLDTVYTSDITWTLSSRPV